MSTATYSEAIGNLASLCDRVLSTREPVVIKRRGRRDVALLPAKELASLMETAYLLRSPRNARRLLGALQRSRSGEGKKPTCGELQKLGGAA